MTYRQFLTEAALRRDVDRLLEEQAEWARKLVKDVEKAFGRGR